MTLDNRDDALPSPAAHGDLSRPRDRAVQIQCIVRYRDREGLLVPCKLEVIWYPPRVPTRAVSAKGHLALGHNLSIGPRDDHIRIKGEILFYGLCLTIAHT